VCVLCGVLCLHECAGAVVRNGGGGGGIGMEDGLGAAGQRAEGRKGMGAEGRGGAGGKTGGGIR
jgi:hypothetical protein